jgi:hypothetical protein
MTINMFKGYTPKEEEIVKHTHDYEWERVRVLIRGNS